MADKQSRREPFFSESEDHERPLDPGFYSPPGPWERIEPTIRLAAFAVLFVCAVLLIEWGTDKFSEYRAVQAANAAVAELEAANRARAAEAERRQRALRERRADTNQGKWLAKNCSDWRRTYDDLGAPTAQREMRRHCRIYQHYLDTGRVVTR
jgi:hypothetical protein